MEHHCKVQERGGKLSRKDSDPSSASPAQGPYPRWIGSYVSCQGTRILEQTMQVARHIRCIVLRSSTEVARSCRRSAVARFMQYGDCIRLLLPRLERTPLPAARQWRYEASAPRSTSCLTRHTSASPDKCCQLRAVAQRLSTTRGLSPALCYPLTPGNSTIALHRLRGSFVFAMPADFSPRGRGGSTPQTGEAAQLCSCLSLSRCEVPVAAHGMIRREEHLGAPERSCAPAGTAAIQAQPIGMG